MGDPSDLVSFGNQRPLQSVLAALKTLGSTRRQIRAAVRSHGVILASVAADVGSPLGAAVGRWLWIAFARGKASSPRR